MEPLSLDEAFLDVTGSVSLFGSATEIAQKIKSDIKQTTRLVASVGVAPNKFLAKIASDLEKPDGLVVVEPERIQDFLDPLPVGRIWGMGKVTGSVLDGLGISTIADLRCLDSSLLTEKFGQHGQHLGKLARGLDDRLVVPDRDAKSISHETTFATDISDHETLRAWLLDLTEHVGRRLRQQHRKGKTVAIKLRFANFRTITRAKTLRLATNVTQEIWQAARQLLNESLSGSRARIRLLGIGVSNLTDAAYVQKELFGEEVHSKQQQLDEVADAVREKFGSAALNRGSGLLHNARHRPDPNTRD